ncbi:MAG: cyclase family protein [Gemmatimonas sp.]
MPPITVVSRLAAPDRPLIDISVPVSADTPEWPGDTPFSCGWMAKRADGEAINLSQITMSPHVGTHADSPLHVEDGWAGSEALPLSAFVGVAYVLDARSAGLALSVEWLQEQFAGEVPERLLLHTGRSIASGAFPEEWPVLTQDAAAWLAKGGTRLVGTDAPSVDERHSKALEVHHELFMRDAFVLENLVLDGVTPGWYELNAAPLKVVGIDAAPVRAILRFLSEHN